MGTAHPTPARGSKLTVSFGLVNVGVKYAPIVREERTRGKYLDPETHGPVTQQYVNEKGKVVKPVTGYPHGDGFVVLDPEDVKALELERDTRLELKAFAELDSIDPLYFEKSYLVWPDKGQEAGYDLLCSVLAATGKVLVGTTVIRKSTKAIVLRYGHGCLLAHACTYDANVAWGDYQLVTQGHDERPAPEQALAKMALELLSALPETFDFAGVEDEYDARLRAAIAGRTIERPIEEELPPVGDLMEALKASVKAAAEKSEPKPKRSRKKAAA